MRAWLNRKAQLFYLDLWVARDYPEQMPEYISARWYHLLWMTVPIGGFILFTEAVVEAHRKKTHARQ